MQCILICILLCMYTWIDRLPNGENTRSLLICYNLKRYKNSKGVWCISQSFCLDVHSLFRFPFTSTTLNFYINLTSLSREERQRRAKLWRTWAQQYFCSHLLAPFILYSSVIGQEQQLVIICVNETMNFPVK